MYAPAVAAIGLMLEDRMIARTSPSSVPRTMLTTVKTIVRTSPRRIDSLVKYLATTSHWKLGLVATDTSRPTPSRMHTAQAAYSNALRRCSLGLRAGSIPFIVGLLPWVVSCTIVSP